VSFSTSQLEVWALFEIRNPNNKAVNFFTLSSKGHSQGRPLDMQIPWIAWGKDVKKGYEIISPVYTCDTAATALWLLGVTPVSKMDGVPVSSAFK
jgi:hypothetical protein